MSAIGKFFRFFTCEHYTELASRKMEEELRPLDKFGYSLHHIICTFCRRSNRQLKLIDKACNKLASEGKLSANNQSLRPEIKEKIKELIN